MVQKQQGLQFCSLEDPVTSQIKESKLGLSTPMLLDVGYPLGRRHDIGQGS